MPLISVDAIDALLPQTQCQLCEFDGCRPYAQAILQKEAPINRCLPGGVDVLRQLAALTGDDPAPFEAELIAKTKAPTRVLIDESICIGCTKCIDACPTDAIIGSGKRMHTVIMDACTGCELCLPPCPIDCIDIIPASPITDAQSSDWRVRHEARNQRLNDDKIKAAEAEANYQKNVIKGSHEQSVTDRQSVMQEALARMQKKKSGGNE